MSLQKRDIPLILLVLIFTSSTLILADKIHLTGMQRSLDHLTWYLGIVRNPATYPIYMSTLIGDHECDASIWCDEQGMSNLVVRSGVLKLNLRNPDGSVNQASFNTFLKFQQDMLEYWIKHIPPNQYFNPGDDCPFGPADGQLLCWERAIRARASFHIDGGGPFLITTIISLVSLVAILGLLWRKRLRTRLSTQEVA